MSLLVPSAQSQQNNLDIIVLKVLAMIGERVVGSGLYKKKKSRINFWNSGDFLT